MATYLQLTVPGAIAKPDIGSDTHQQPSDMQILGMNTPRIQVPINVQHFSHETMVTGSRNCSVGALDLCL